MDVIALANTKGGVGKTTLALHLGVEAERAGRKVVWVDLDPQGSLTEAWEARAAATPALAEVAAMAAEAAGERRARKLGEELGAKLRSLAAEGYDLAVVDTPPEHYQAVHLNAGLAAATAVLVPIQPTPLALRAVGALLAKLTPGRRFAFVVNEASPNRFVQSTPQAVAELSAHGRVAPVILHRRELYATATADGRTAGEIAPGHTAAREVRELWTFVETWIDERTDTSKRASTEKQKIRA
jgi:chromosome partitioning protein